MKFSAFGQRFLKTSGILSLMDDLGCTLAERNTSTIMMGGGNPSRIPEVELIFKERLQKIIDNPTTLHHLIGTYDPPSGQQSFIRTLADFFRRNYGWDITEKNICLTHGSQHAFFMLFNLFGGSSHQNCFQRILLPLAPEYIGYDNTGIEPDIFFACKPDIEYINSQIFKYHINFKELESVFRQSNHAIGAICVSRPSNPSGNILTDQEIQKLHSYAKSYDIPLILDNAYGRPFPCIFSTDHSIFWDEHIVLCLTLSKLGLPAVRTGIIIASEHIVTTLTRMNAIMTLSTGSLGGLLMEEILRDDSIIDICRNKISPYYEVRRQHTVSYLLSALRNTPVMLHQAEGALFLWLWLRDSPITSHALYSRLKKRGVIVVSGHYFFPGISQNWQHCQECIRITYTQPVNQVKQGIDIIAQEIKYIYNSK